MAQCLQVINWHVVALDEDVLIMAPHLDDFLKVGENCRGKLLNVGDLATSNLESD